MTDFKRARNPEAKEVRKHSILEAATTLYQENPVALPTTSQISKKCNISKGALYLYFKTKEEIFLSIVETYQLEWLDIFSLDDIDSTQEKIEPAQLQASLDKACSYASQHPIFMHLASMSSNTIEPNIDTKILLTHKNTIGNKISKLAQSTSEKLPMLTSAQIASLIIRSYSTLLGLWQVSGPIEHVNKVLKTSDLHIFTPDFEATSREMLKQIWMDEINNSKQEKGGLLGRLFSNNSKWSN
ncbi:TetR family transcriptional regulator [Alteromonas sp. a30]|uniref:TetR family transcriptional regulator n=1 Tax=Alteromonas sp. a30 TaxID=2730917 RepID=UPI002282DA38|nr:TetR family transcriptional regulator [Alteromonas sp. a30]MCY7295773.1 TetR family transcriptional regulator [Alteromonas sp. a30]